MVRIWFNHWFSTVYHIISLMRENEPDFYVIGSNERQEAVYRLVCDEWYQEPAYTPGGYVDFCLEFCKTHRIDVFCPRRGMLDISRRQAEFAAIGTRLLADSYDKIALLNQKADAYNFIREHGIAPVPDYFVVTNVHDFETACADITAKNGTACFKFVHDEGGMSFHIIDNGRKGYVSLFHKSAARITMEDAVAALSERENFSPLMVMPYLPGNEISVDALKTSSGIIMLPRIKGASRVEKLCYDPEILAMCRRFYEHMPLECPCNIQFKYLGDTPYFLEVNTRMSGGVQLGCFASGVNIPNIAVNKLLGNARTWADSMAEKRVAYVETPVVLG